MNLFTEIVFTISDVKIKLVALIEIEFYWYFKPCGFGKQLYVHKIKEWEQREKRWMVYAKFL